MKSQAINLGDRVQDVVTEYEGIVTGICQHLTGCDTVGVTPQGAKTDGGTKDTVWFDINRIDVLQPGAVTIESDAHYRTLAEVGGPQDAPRITRSHPKS